jgi:hypothetical protein
MGERMSRGRIGLAAVFAVAAVGAALAAADVHAWRAAIAGGDRTYARTPSRAVWQPRTFLGGGAATLLGVGGDLRLRDALRQYVDASRLRLRLDNAVQVEAAWARAQDSLAAVARSGDRRSASQALTLLGILAFRQSASGGTQSQVDAARSDFSEAVRANPANADAAYDLELLLRLTAAHGSREEPGQGTGFGRTGRRGGGGAQPGSGY